MNKPQKPTRGGKRAGAGRPKTSAKKTITLRLTQKTLTELSSMAKVTGVSRSAMVEAVLNAAMPPGWHLFPVEDLDKTIRATKLLCKGLLAVDDTVTLRDLNYLSRDQIMDYQNALDLAKKLTPSPSASAQAPGPAATE